MGEKSDNLTEEIMRTFGSSYSNAKRLVATELCHAQIESTVDKYKADGIKEVRILETNDDRTCDLCRSMDGQIIKIEDLEPGINCPPFHPNCRGTLLAVI